MSSTESQPGLTQLKILRLGGAAITDAGLAHLSLLSQRQQLDLWDTAVTGLGVKKLQHALPNCAIDWNLPTPATDNVGCADHPAADEAKRHAGRNPIPRPLADQR